LYVGRIDSAVVEDVVDIGSGNEVGAREVGDDLLQELRGV
jgi:hypothetical protein